MKLIYKTSILVFMVLAASCGGNSGDKGTSSKPVPGYGAVYIPFNGNTYVTDVKSGDLLTVAARTIDTYDGALTGWDNPGIMLSAYFKTAKAGSYKLFADVALPSGTEESTLTFSDGRNSYPFTVKGTGIAYIGEFSTSGNEYVKMDIKGSAKPSGARFATVSQYIIDGDVMGEGSIFVPSDKVSDCYWYRRGPSVHMNYTLPSGNVEWFYNEVTVPEGKDVDDTYFMLTGFGEGYMGIQTHDNGPNSVLFSVWSPFETDKPGEIPADYRVKTLRKGEGVTAQDFGGEGSGGQSFMDYAWEPGKTYRTLVHVRPDGKGNTEYTGYFGDEKGEWHLLASFLRPHTDTWYTRPHSFLECFVPETSIKTREVRFKNQWAIMHDGSFVELTEARFTCDNTGRTGMRADMFGGCDGSEFILRNCGFFSEKTEYGSTFTRKAQGNKPEIDFTALP